MKLSSAFIVILLVICFAFSGYLWYQLGDVSIQLEEAKNKVVSTENELTRTINTLESTKNQLRIVEDDNVRMLKKYVSFKQEIEHKAGVRKQDFQSFVTPNDNLVSEKAQEITGGYSGETSELWKDYYELYLWVVKNIRYSYDSELPMLPEGLEGELVWRRGYLRLPAETLIDETGDCEDMAFLLLSLMRSYNQEKYTVWGVGMSSDASGHVGVAFPVSGGKLAILDPAGNYFTGSDSPGFPTPLHSESTSIAVNEWLAHLESKMPGAFISKVFTDDYYYEFESTDEFLAWIESR
jgi:hypothetical protein